VSPEYAKAAIRAHATNYAKRVIAKQINDSAVEGLLRADAEAFADLPEIADAVFACGLDSYRWLRANSTVEKPK